MTLEEFCDEVLLPAFNSDAAAAVTGFDSAMTGLGPGEPWIAEVEDGTRFRITVTIEDGDG